MPTTSASTTHRRARPRHLLATAAALATLGCTASTQGPTVEGTSAQASVASAMPAVCASDAAGVHQELAHLERRRDGRVGIYARDTGTDASIAYRADERFAYASTIKALAAAAVLDRISRRQLSQRLSWTTADLVPHSPITERYVEEGLTVKQVLDAAVTVSDNTAANLMLDLLGGPAALDDALEGVGDDVTSVVRREPELNSYQPGDERDTTTPRAIGDSLRAYALGDELSEPDRRLLNDMLRRNTTGDALIRAAVPPEWKVGDKTGSASYGTRNDIAVLTPPGRDPIILTVFTRHHTADAPTDDALVAQAARIALDGLCASPVAGH